VCDQAFGLPLLMVTLKNRHAKTLVVPVATVMMVAKTGAVAEMVT
jgi:hypothetical protein